MQELYTSYQGKNTREQKAIRSLTQWNRYHGMPRNAYNNALMVAHFIIGFVKKTPTKNKRERLYFLACFMA